MTSSTSATRVDRRARGAVATLFLTNGALLANILPRFPEIKEQLGIDNTVYGLAITAFPIGAIVAGLASAALIRRFGSARVAVFGTVLTSLGVLAAGVAPSIMLFALGLSLGGAMDAITDVAQNAHGLRVQRNYGRSILNSFHAVWSVGAVLGGTMAAVAIALALPIGVHLAGSAAIFSAASLTALRFCLRGPDTTSGGVARGDSSTTPPKRTASIPPRVILMLTALVIIAIAGTVVEDAGNSWASLYLGSLGAPATIAATGFIALVGAQFIGRLLGDKLIDRFGQRLVARVGGGVVALGMGLALAFPTIPGAIIGFAAAGLGVATLVPAAMSEADALPGLRPGTGLTVVSWLMRLGFLLSPPVVGLLADAAGLRVGLMTIPVVGVCVIVFAAALRRYDRT